MARWSALSSLFLCVIWTLATGRVFAVDQRSVAYDARRVLGISVHVITVNLNDPHIKVSIATAQGFPRANEPFGTLIGHAAPAAAITGTYFHKSSFHPVGEIVADGRVRSRGRVGTVMAITPYNAVTFAPSPRERRGDWRAHETVLGAGPRLLADGEVAVKARREGFRDPHVLGRASRTAVGLTAHNKLLLVAVRRAVTLTELAKIMKAMGCVQAMNLDGGSSSALYFDGKAAVSPRRPLVNLLVVHQNVPLLARMVPRLSAEARSNRSSWIATKAAEHFSAAERLSARGRNADAVRHYRAAAYLAAGNASYSAALGSTLEASGEKHAAANAFATAGHILVRKQRYQAALARLKKAVTLNPLEVSAYDDLAIAYAHVQAAQRQGRAASGAVRPVQEGPDGSVKAPPASVVSESGRTVKQGVAMSHARRAAAARAHERERPYHRSRVSTANELYVHVTIDFDELLKRERIGAA